MPPKPIPHQVVIEDDELQPLLELFHRVRRSNTKRIPRQRQYESLQVFRFGTWIVDLVQFKAMREPIWYVFFVHANSRYLIVYEGSVQMLTPNAIELPMNRRQRVKSDVFLPMVNDIHERFGIKYLIGDSEKAFWSHQMLRYYQTHNIIPYPVNVERDGHNQMAVLDRCVRTIRDYAYQARINDFTPTVMKQLAVIYNNQKHTTLTSILKRNAIVPIGKTISPSTVFHNPVLERILIALMREKNRQKHARVNDFVLPDGAEVYVKNIHNPREQTYPGNWHVLSHHGSTYTVKDDTTGKIISVSRALILRPSMPRSINKVHR